MYDTATRNSAEHKGVPDRTWWEAPRLTTMRYHITSCVKRSVAQHFRRVVPQLIRNSAAGIMVGEQRQHGVGGVGVVEPRAPPPQDLPFPVPVQLLCVAVFKLLVLPGEVLVETGEE